MVTTTVSGTEVRDMCLIARLLILRRVRSSRPGVSLDRCRPEGPESDAIRLTGGFLQVRD